MISAISIRSNPRRAWRGGLLTLAWLILLGPLHVWNQQLVRIPDFDYVDIAPGRLTGGTETIFWTHHTPDSDTRIEVFDVATAERLGSSRPWMVHEGNRRVTLSEVPAMNGYKVRIEDRQGKEPPREIMANLYGTPCVVGARFLVWSRRGFYEVLDLDEKQPSIIETMLEGTTDAENLKAIPGTDRFYRFARPPIAGQPRSLIELFKIDAGQVVPLANWPTSAPQSVGFTEDCILSWTTKGTIEIHSTVDGSLLKEVAIPTNYAWSMQIVGGLVLAPTNKGFFDVLRERVVQWPNSNFMPIEFPDRSTVIYVSEDFYHPCRMGAYDLDAEKVKYELDLPFFPRNSTVDKDELLIASCAQGISALVLDVRTGEIKQRCEPYRSISLSAIWFVLCVAVWSVGWIAIGPFGRAWIDAPVAIVVIGLVLWPYSASIQFVAFTLVVSSYALWQALLCEQERIHGVLRWLLIVASGCALLYSDVPQQALLACVWVAWLSGIFVSSGIGRLMKIRIRASQAVDSSGGQRLTITHLMTAMAIVAVWSISLRGLVELGWDRVLLNIRSVETKLMWAVMAGNALFGVASWLGMLQPRLWRSGQRDVALAVALVGLAIFPRLYDLWFGYSLVGCWATQLFPNTAGGTWAFQYFSHAYLAEDVWETLAICLFGPCLLGMVFRRYGYRLEKQAQFRPAATDSQQALVATSE